MIFVRSIQMMETMKAVILVTLFLACVVSAKHEASEKPSVPRESVLDFLKTIKFTEGYDNLWGVQHQQVSDDGSSVSILIDPSSGSGFKSKKPYMYGLFNAALKLQGQYTAGIITTFYLSNSQVYIGKHDEVDFEFLGTIPGEPYKLQTNVYGNGSGDGAQLIGREQQFHLWFDPTTDYHNYTILWTPHHILWLVDGILIRRFAKTKGLEATFPSKPMSAYATIWDGSAWATDGGKYKANYTYGPFISNYTNFKIIGCQQGGGKHRSFEENCSAVQLLECMMSPTHMDKKQMQALDFVRKNYMTYDYCQDFQLYPKGTMPECSASPIT